MRASRCLDAWTLVGVADVHRFLQEGQIFACIEPIDTSEVIYLEGPTSISRSSTIHPSNVQMVNAIG
jgi:RNA-dependent RNA polymerase